MAEIKTPITINITGGSGGASRFGIDDVTTSANRNVDMGAHSFSLMNTLGVAFVSINDGGASTSFSQNTVQINGSASSANKGSQFTLTATNDDSDTILGLVSFDNIANKSSTMTINPSQVAFQFGTPGTIRNLTLPFPAQDAYIATSVNGIHPDSTGNITIASSTSSKFGLGDTNANESRVFDANQHVFSILNTTVAQITSQNGTKSSSLQLNTAQFNLNAASTTRGSAVSAYVNNDDTFTSVYLNSYISGGNSNQLVINPNGAAFIRTIGGIPYSIDIPHPTTDAMFVTSVNGVAPDNAGNVTISAGGATTTASNGLTKNVNDIQLGGTMTANTTITNNYDFTITRNNGAPILSLVNTSTTQSGIGKVGLYIVSYSGGIPLDVATANGSAMTASNNSTDYATYSAAGYGSSAVYEAYSTGGGYCADFNTKSLAGNTVISNIRSEVWTNTTPANGLGSSFEFWADTYLPASANPKQLQSSLISKWSTAAGNTRTATFEIQTTINAVTAKRLSIGASGILNIVNTPSFTSNATAISGGLVVGDVYRNGDALMIVH